VIPAADHRSGDAAVVALLTAHGVDLRAWGVGEAKTLDHLRAELSARECVLLEQDGLLVRLAEGAHVLVTHHGLALTEAFQEFRDGRRRRRALCVAEKRRRGEPAVAAAVRGLGEELGLGVAAERLRLLGNLADTFGSRSYPGLLNSFGTTYFTYDLPPGLFRPEFVEEQPDKRTVWTWQEPPDWWLDTWRRLGLQPPPSESRGGCAVPEGR